jgi:sec-independent protein translocase protein TatA
MGFDTRGISDDNIIWQLKLDHDDERRVSGAPPTVGAALASRVATRADRRICAMGWLSPWHWLVIMIVAVLLFGNRLPEIARSLGRSVNEFKRGLKDVKDNLDSELNDDPPREKLAPPPEPPRGEQLEQEEKEKAPSEVHKE